MVEKVRYQVLGRVFVNGSLIDPKGRKDVFVHAAAGLEGKALKLAPEKGAAKAKAASGGNGGNASGDDNNKPAGEGRGGENAG